MLYLFSCDSLGVRHHPNVQLTSESYSETTVNCKPVKPNGDLFIVSTNPERNGFFSSTLCPLGVVWQEAGNRVRHSLQNALGLCAHIHVVPFRCCMDVSETDASLTTVWLFMRLNYTCIPNRALYLHSCFMLERLRVKYCPQLSDLNAELMTLCLTTRNKPLQKSHTNMEIYTCGF